MLNSSKKKKRMSWTWAKFGKRMLSFDDLMVQFYASGIIPTLQKKHVCLHINICLHQYTGKQYEEEEEDKKKIEFKLSWTWAKFGILFIYLLMLGRVGFTRTKSLPPATRPFEREHRSGANRESTKTCFNRPFGRVGGRVSGWVKFFVQP